MVDNWAELRRDRALWSDTADRLDPGPAPREGGLWRGHGRPRPGQRLHDLVTVSLGGTGTIAHIVNSTGGPSNSSTNVANWVNYP